MAEEKLLESDLSCKKEFEDRFFHKVEDIEKPLSNYVLDQVKKLPTREQEAFKRLQSINYELSNLLISLGYNAHSIKDALQRGTVYLICSHINRVQSLYEYEDGDYWVACDMIRYQMDDLKHRLSVASDLANITNHNCVAVSEDLITHLVFSVLTDLRKLIYLLVFGGNLAVLPNEEKTYLTAGGCDDIYEACRMPICHGDIQKEHNNDFRQGWNEGKEEVQAMASDPKLKAELDEVRRVARKYRLRADLMELFKDNPDQDNLLKELDQALLKV